MLAPPVQAAPPGAEGNGRMTMLDRLVHDDRGSATAEYAVAMMAAVGFAGLLVVILKGGEVRGLLTDLVRNALSVG
jgi:Flp pilus assembly pilin Flp